MSTYESIQTASGTTSVVITKPTGLAVGDLLVAGIHGNDDNGSTVALTTPAGWTLDEAQTVDTNSGVLSVFTKTADSADVAASNFTFASTGDAARNMQGGLLRISNFGILAGETSSNGSGAASTLTSTGFTPTRANTLFVAFTGLSSTGTGSTVTSFTLTTSNPTWTERADFTEAIATKFISFGVHTATRPETTDTGTITVTYNQNSSQRMMIVLALSPKVNGSVTPITKVNGYAYTGVQSAKVNAISDDATTNTSKYTGWQNETLPTTNWQNETL